MYNTSFGKENKVVDLLDSSPLNVLIEPWGFVMNISRPSNVSWQIFCEAEIDNFSCAVRAAHLKVFFNTKFMINEDRNDEFTSVCSLSVISKKIIQFFWQFFLPICQLYFTCLEEKLELNFDVIARFWFIEIKFTHLRTSVYY